jgi:hypothetical protein
VDREIVGGGEAAAALGVRLGDDGRIVIPIRLQVASEGGLNLVPVDYCVRAFLALFEEGLEGGIYHIVNPRPTRIEDIVAWSESCFRIGGIVTCGPEGFDGRPKNALETLYDTHLKTYRPYMQDERTFDDARAAPILKAGGVACPVFDEALFSRCMDYAVEADWGSQLFAP